MWGWGEETAGRLGSWKETESRSCSSGEPCPKWRGKTPQAGRGAEPRCQGSTGARTLCNVLTRQGFLESPAENLKSLLVHAAPGPQKAGEETHSGGDLREHVCSLPGPAGLAHVVCNSGSGSGGGRQREVSDGTCRTVSLCSLASREGFARTLPATRLSYCCESRRSRRRSSLAAASGWGRSLASAPPRAPPVSVPPPPTATSSALRSSPADVSAGNRS